MSNEQYLYLKANSEKERQQWLVALGSAKASLANRQQRRRISASTSSSPFSDTTTIPAAAADISKDHSNATRLLKSKKSELRLYCDLLMQQIHTVKTGATSDTVQTIEQGSHLLQETCDTFIHTLDELMELADQHFHIYGTNERVSRTGISYVVLKLTDFFPAIKGTKYNSISLCQANE